jgi:hypothetical protein
MCELLSSIESKADSLFIEFFIVDVDSYTFPSPSFSLEFAARHIPKKRERGGAIVIDIDLVTSHLRIHIVYISLIPFFHTVTRNYVLKT